MNDRNPGSKLLRGEMLTRKLWDRHFPDAFWARGCMFRGHMAPSLIGLDYVNLASEIKYGSILIPKVEVEKFPEQRQQMKLRLFYGSKKVVTFNTNIAKMQVMEPNFALVWQPEMLRNCSAQTADSVTPKFPFDRKKPQQLTAELELYDRSCLKKKSIMMLTGKTTLEEMLPKENSKILHNQVSIPVRSLEGDQQAKIQLITRTLHKGREMILDLGEFKCREMGESSQLYQLCCAGALKKPTYGQLRKIWMATHT